MHLAHQHPSSKAHTAMDMCPLHLEPVGSPPRCYCKPSIGLGRVLLRDVHELPRLGEVPWSSIDINPTQFLHQHCLQSTRKHLFLHGSRYLAKKDAESARSLKQHHQHCLVQPQGALLVTLPQHRPHIVKDVCEQQGAHGHGRLAEGCGAAPLHQQLHQAPRTQILKCTGTSSYA